MLAQVLWRQIVYQYRHHNKVERGAIPQGTIVFLANSDDRTATVIYEDMVLVVSCSALNLLESEQDIIPIEELQKKYHNNRNSPCLVR
jgi:hypothetical protein